MNIKNYKNIGHYLSKNKDISYVKGLIEERGYSLDTCLSDYNNYIISDTEFYSSTSTFKLFNKDYLDLKYPVEKNLTSLIMRLNSRLDNLGILIYLDEGNGIDFIINKIIKSRNENSLTFMTIYNNTVFVILLIDDRKKYNIWYQSFNKKEHKKLLENLKDNFFELLLDT